MNKVKAFLTKYHFAYVPILITLFMLLINAVRYGSHDDVIMYEIANSFSTNPHSEHLVFISVYIGYLLRLLYSLMPSLNWFSLLYLCVINLYFICLNYTIIKRNGRYLLNLMLYSLQLYVLLHISFTVITFIGVVTGVLWFLAFVKELSGTYVKHIIFAFLLVFIAFGFRKGQILYFAILAVVPLLLIMLLKKELKAWLAAFIIFTIVFSGYCNVYINNSYKSKLPSEMYYNEFNEYRSAATDGGLFNYDNNKEMLEREGVSENDYNLYSNFIYVDKEVFTKDKIKAIGTRSFTDKYDTNIFSILDYVKITVADCAFIYLFAAFALLVFIMYKKQRLKTFLISGMILSSEAYFYIVRRARPRVVNPVAIFGIILLIFIIAGVKSEVFDFNLLKKYDRKFVKRLLSSITVIAILFFSTLFVYVNFIDLPDYDEIYEYCEEDESRVYLSDVLTRYLLADYELNVLSSDYYIIPIHHFSDWPAYTYFWYDEYNRLGLSEYADNTANSLLEDNVYYITNNDEIPDMLVTYFEEHYGKKVIYEVEKSFNYNNTVYKFSEINY